MPENVVAPGRFRVIILGNDAQLYARPATPVQLARACLELGYDFVAPASWGDELVAHHVLDRVRTGEPGPTIVTHCPHVVRTVAAGRPLRHATCASVAPPVAVARYLRSAFHPRVPHLAFAGRCESGADETIDEHLTPESLLARLLDAGLAPPDQPNHFDGVLPADRSRYASLGGGAPHPQMLQRLAAASLHDVAPETVATVARACPIGERVVLDLALSCGCICARDRLALERLEPPRAASSVINLQVSVDLTPTRPDAAAGEPNTAHPLDPPAPTERRPPHVEDRSAAASHSSAVAGAFDRLLEATVPVAPRYWATPDAPPRPTAAARWEPPGGDLGLPPDDEWFSPPAAAPSFELMDSVDAPEADASAESTEVLALNLDIDEEVLAAIDRARAKHRRMTPAPTDERAHFDVPSAATTVDAAPPLLQPEGVAATAEVGPAGRLDAPDVADTSAAPESCAQAPAASLEGELSFLASIFSDAPPASSSPAPFLRALAEDMATDSAVDVATEAPAVSAFIAEAASARADEVTVVGPVTAVDVATVETADTIDPIEVEPAASDVEPTESAAPLPGVINSDAAWEDMRHAGATAEQADAPIGESADMSPEPRPHDAAIELVVIDYAQDATESVEQATQSEEAVSASAARDGEEIEVELELVAASELETLIDDAFANIDATEHVDIAAATDAAFAAADATATFEPEALTHAASPPVAAAEAPEPAPLVASALEDVAPATVAATAEPGPGDVEAETREVEAPAQGVGSGAEPVTLVVSGEQPESEAEPLEDVAAASAAAVSEDPAVETPDELASGAGEPVEASLDASSAPAKDVPPDAPLGVDTAAPADAPEGSPSAVDVEVEKDRKVGRDFWPSDHTAPGIEVRSRVTAPLMNGQRVAMIAVALLLIAAGVVVATQGVDRVVGWWRSAVGAVTGRHAEAPPALPPNDSLLRRVPSGSADSVNGAGAATDSARAPADGVPDTAGSRIRERGTSTPPAAPPAVPAGAERGTRPDSSRDRDTARGAPPENKIATPAAPSTILPSQPESNSRVPAARANQAPRPTSAVLERPPAGDTAAPTVFRADPAKALESDSIVPATPGSTVFKNGVPRPRQASKLRPVSQKP